MAEPRWRALRERRADLGGAIDLQRVLITRGLDLGSALDRQRLPVAERPAGALAARLAGGEPVRLDESVEVDAALPRALPARLLRRPRGGWGGRPGAPPARGPGARRDRRRVAAGGVARAAAGGDPDAGPARRRLARPDVGGGGDGGRAPRLPAAAAGRSRRRRRTRNWRRRSRAGSADTAPPAGRGRHWRSSGSAAGDGDRHGDRARGGDGDGERRLRCSFCGAGWRFAERACIYCAARRRDARHRGGRRRVATGRALPVVRRAT